MKFLEELIRELTAFTPLSALLRLLLAALFGGLMGIERGRHGRAAGLRTHILVCLGAALAALVGLYSVQTLGYQADPLRVGAQVISGIGFLGVGTILIKGRFQVTGLTTAAGLWATAAIGLACGIGFYEGAAVTTIFVLITTTLLARLEARINRKHRRFGLYIELSSVEAVQSLAAFLGERYGAGDVQITPPRSAIPNYVGVETIIFTNGRKDTTLARVIDEVSAQPGVVFALESV